MIVYIIKRKENYQNKCTILKTDNILYTFIKKLDKEIKKQSFEMLIVN